VLVKYFILKRSRKCVLKEVDVLIVVESVIVFNGVWVSDGVWVNLKLSIKRVLEVCRDFPV